MSRFANEHLEKFSQVAPVIQPDAVNFEGHRAFEESGIKHKIARLALTGVLGNQFYRKEEDVAKELVEVCRAGAAADPLYLLKAAHVSRENDLKLFPKLAIAAVLARNDLKPATKELVEDVAVKVLSTYSPGQLLEFVETVKQKVFGAGLGRRERRVINKVIEGWKASRLEGYTLSEFSNMNQLFRISHPNLGSNPLVRYLFGGEAATERQAALEVFKTAKEDKVRAQLIIDHRLPFNTIKGMVPNTDRVTWKAISENMSPLALLLNLRALHEKGVMNPRDLQAMLDKTGGLGQRTRLLPFDILRPLEHADACYREVLIDYMARLVGEPIPALEDMVVGILQDCSGSMRGQPWLTSCALLAPILTSCRERYYALFNTQVWPEGLNGVPYLKDSGKKGVLHNMMGTFKSGGTDIHRAISYYLENKIKVDVLILATDEQQNGRGQAYTAWNLYRKQINKNAKLMVINCTQTQWHLAPDVDDSIVFIQTMTPKIYNYIATLGTDVVKVIEQTNLEVAAE